MQGTLDRARFLFDFRDCWWQNFAMNNIETYFDKQKQLFAFNIWDLNSVKAVLDAAASVGKDVILQTSASIFANIPLAQMREFVTSYADSIGIDAWLHLDHCRNIAMINDAIQYGWDSVMIDASDKDIETNIQMTNHVAALAHQNGVLVEAEVGQVKGIEDHVINETSAVASREDIDCFLQNTNIDMIAVAFGNAHGIYRGEPELNYDLVEYTVLISRLPFVVHGASGLSDEVLKRLLAMEHVRKINISTEVKLAYRAGFLGAEEKGLLGADGFQAIGVEACIHDAIVSMAMKKFVLLDA